MANAGFSAYIDYFGPIEGLTARSSQDGRTAQQAECLNSFGDAVCRDVYGGAIAPTVEYAVTGDITGTTNFPKLGQVVKAKVPKIVRKEDGTTETSVEEVPVMIVSVAATTGAGNPATVTITGQQVEEGARSKRTYPVVFGSGLKPRTKAQDVCGAFKPSDCFSAFTTTFSVDPHVATVTGEPVASDASHARVEVQATMYDGDGTHEIELAADGGFEFTAKPAESRPDAGYIERTATASKTLEADFDRTWPVREDQQDPDAEQTSTPSNG